MPDEIVEVAQADREAAAAYFTGIDGPKSLRAQNCLLGRMDYLPTVRAFARHRLAATADLKASNAALVEALDEIKSLAKNKCVHAMIARTAGRALQAYADGEKV